MAFCVRGIYSKELYEVLTGLHVLNYGWELRPTEFSFVQEHILMRIAQECRRSHHVWYLNLISQKDFITKKITTDLIIKASVPRDSLIIETDEVSSFFAQEKLNYRLLINNIYQLGKVAADPYCKELLLPWFKLEKLVQTQEIHSFMEVVEQVRRKKNIKLSLQLPWEQSLPFSFLDRYSIDHIVLDIGPEVETSYRNVDINLVGQHLQVLEQNLKN